MARPNKTGLEYFPFDVDTENDEKIQLIVAEHGINGYAIISMLWCRIYKNGYYYYWTKKEQLLFSKRVNVDINLVNAVVNSAIEWELFNRTLFEKYQIFTSVRIQETFLEVISRRKNVEIIGAYVLVNINTHRNAVKVNIIGVNAYNNPIKESKEKETEIRKERETEIEKKEVVYDVDLILISSLLNYFGFTEMRNPDKQLQAYTFLKILTTDNRLDYFTEQFTAYKTYKTTKQEIKHGFNSFLGSIEERFNDGGWNAKNWVAEVKQLAPVAVNGNGGIMKYSGILTD